MKYFLFDASSAVPFYLPRPTDYNFNARGITASLTARRLSKKAFFYIPCLCITEVLNTLARYHFRLKATTPEEYKRATEAFIKHVRDRQFFYCYYSNRYHNYHANEVFPIEHTKNTEYTVTGLDPQKTKPLEVDQALKTKNPNDRASNYHLSGADIFIIGMARELQKIHGLDFALITQDNRLAEIASSLSDPYKVFNFSAKAQKPNSIKELKAF